MDRDRARERILQRVRAAAAARDRVAHPGDLQAAGVPCEPLLERFTERFTANGGEVVRFAAAGEAREWLAGFAAGFEAAAASPLLPAGLSAGLPQAPPEEAPLGISLALAAAAETGSLLLDSREGRLLQLLPPTHLIWVEARAVAATLAEALSALPPGLPAAIGLHSGPSRSADIGMVTVTGVHGPGRVIAAIVEEGARHRERPPRLAGRERNEKGA